MKLDQYWQALEPAMNSAKLLFWVWEIASDEVVFSNNWQELSQGEKGEKTKMARWLEHVHPADLGAVRATLAACRRGAQKAYRMEYRLKTAGGGVSWMQEYGSVAERDEDGNPSLVVGLQQDVSGFEQVKAELLGKQRQLDDIADVSMQAQWEWDCEKDRFVFSNHFFNTYGYTRPQLAETLGGWLELVHAEDRAGVTKAIQRYLGGVADECRVELRMRTREGEYVWVALSGLIVQRKGDRPLRLAGSLTNVDRMKRAETALSAALEDNRKYSDRLQEEVAKTEADLRHSQGDLVRQDRLLRVVNNIALHLMEVEDEAYGGTVREALRDLGEAVEADKVSILRNAEIDGELAACPLYHWEMGPPRHSGEEGAGFRYSAYSGWLQRLMRGEPVNERVGELTGNKREFFEKLGAQSILLLPIHVGDEYWGIAYFADSHRVRLSDEAELKTLQAGASMIVLGILRSQMVERLRDAMVRARAGDQAKSLFLANMSHEMRTPMNAIIGMAEVAREAPEKTGECLSNIKVAAGHLQGIINDVLEVANAGTLLFKLDEAPFALDELLRNIVAVNGGSAREKGVDFRLQKDTLNGLRLVGDAGRLARAVNNLVNNAIAFTPRGGQVRLAVGQTGQKDGRVALQVTVADSGPGIDPRLRENLFTPFVQGEEGLNRSREGAGLGLALTKTFVEKMGGSIGVESEVGFGSTFTIRLSLPLAAEEEALPEQATQAGEVAADFTGRRVLLVEDNEINRTVVTAMLEETGAAVDCVPGGAEAIERIAAGKYVYDVVLMDIQMPGMDGYEATRQIRALPAEDAATLPILAVTANAFEEDVERCLAAGMNGHVPKPVDYGVLVEAIQRQLET